MGLRFYRRVRVAPGVTVNLSKSGASVSAGIRGAHVTAGPRGTRETVGLPGTGLSYTATQSRPRAQKQQTCIGLFHALLIAFVLAGILAVIGVPPDIAAWIALTIAGLAWIGGRLPQKLVIIAVAGTTALASTGARADSTYERRCYRDEHRVLQCRYRTETEHGTVTTYCASGRRNGKCETETEPKGPPPAPTIEQSAQGVMIMRGGPR